MASRPTAYQRETCPDFKVNDMVEYLRGAHCIGTIKAVVFRSGRPTYTVKLTDGKVIQCRSDDLDYHRGRSVA